MMRCDMAEKIYGLLGESLQHSWSVPIHQELGCADYRLYEVPSSGLRDFLETNEIGGLNVTIPYKKTVIPFCATLDDNAREIGAVNTILRDSSGGLRGYNTDAFGFSYLAKRAGIRFNGAKVVILGTGGASLTAQSVARREGASQVVCISRKNEPTYDRLPDFADADILVNATPVGMYPDTGDSPADLTVFRSLKGVIDVIYNPIRTALILQAEKLGIPHSDGLPMLVAQAVEAERIFTGNDIPDLEIERILTKLRREMLNVVIIGMPGSGKTTIGKLLGEKTGRKVVDFDTEVEKTTGKAIPSIFAESGEEVFRNLESKIVRKYGKESGLVLVTGGGAVTRQENYEPLHQNGIIYQLERDTSKLPREGRPISLSVDLDDLFQRRMTKYEAFRDSVVDNNGTPEEAAEDLWRNFLENTGN